MDQIDTGVLSQRRLFIISPESKTKKLRKMVRARQHKRENNVKSEIYTLSADARK